MLPSSIRVSKRMEQPTRRPVRRPLLPSGSEAKLAVAEVEAFEIERSRWTQGVSRN